jgi:hypothetical protein
MLPYFGLLAKTVRPRHALRPAGNDRVRDSLPTARRETDAQDDQPAMTALLGTITFIN